jgi:hypothetical protein
MTNAIVIAIIVLMGVGAFYLWRFLLRRGVRRVLAVFRELKALDAKRAKTLNELGLEQQPYLRRMFRPRDYNKTAADLLYRQGIIKVVPDTGRFYLDERALKQSRLASFVGEAEK